MSIVPGSTGVGGGAASARTRHSEGPLLHDRHRRPGFFDQQDACHLESQRRSDRISFGTSDYRGLTQGLRLDFCSSFKVNWRR